ncbi:phosphate acyltransferase PlsX [Chloroflexota bacterium]
MIIAIDASGGDYAPHEIVKGAIKAAQEYDDVEIALVGRKDIISILTGRHLGKLAITIVDAKQVIGPTESPIEAVNSKPNSSIVTGINLVKDGSASAFISAGNTGAIFYSALANLGRIEGIERPAIASTININSTAPVLLIDAGANADCRPNHMVQFAQLGNIYAREIYGISAPRIGLLNNGQEESKGNRLAKESHNLIKKTRLNFIGNIEGQDIIKGKADVVVTDGFTGNIVLKTMEGLGDTFLKLRPMRQLLSQARHLQGSGLIFDVKLSSLIRGMDYREYGGACILGMNGNIIKAHGRSQASAIRTAVGLAKQTVERGICQKIKEESYEQTDPGR